MFLELKLHTQAAAHTCCDVTHKHVQLIIRTSEAILRVCQCQCWLCQEITAQVINLGRMNTPKTQISPTTNHHSEDIE